MNKTDPKCEAAIVEACANGMTGKAAAEKFGVSASAVTNILRRNGVKTRTGRPPSCELDHGAFDVATPESFYWTGFLFADGCVGSYGQGAPSVILELAEKDRAHVEKFRAFLKSTHAITTALHKDSYGRDGTTKSAAFRVRSQRLVDALVKRGLAKHCPERVPSVEAADSLDFWRGAVDGDGTVRIASWKNRPHRYPQIILCGHVPLLESYQAFLLRRGIAANMTATKSGIFSVQLMGAGALTVVRALYGTAPDEIAMNRKLSDARTILATFG